MMCRSLFCCRFDPETRHDFHYSKTRVSLTKRQKPQEFIPGALLQRIILNVVSQCIRELFPHSSHPAWDWQVLRQAWKPVLQRVRQIPFLLLKAQFLQMIQRAQN